MAKAAKVGEAIMDASFEDKAHMRNTQHTTERDKQKPGGYDRRREECMASGSVIGISHKAPSTSEPEEWVYHERLKILWADSSRQLTGAYPAEPRDRHTVSSDRVRLVLPIRLQLREKFTGYIARRLEPLTWKL